MTPLPLVLFHTFWQTPLPEKCVLLGLTLLLHAHILFSLTTDQCHKFLAILKLLQKNHRYKKQQNLISAISVQFQKWVEWNKKRGQTFEFFLLIMKVTKAYVLFGQTPPPPYFFILFCLTPPPLLAAYVLYGWPLRLWEYFLQHDRCFSL